MVSTISMKLEDTLTVVLTIFSEQILSSVSTNVFQLSIVETILSEGQ